MHYLKRSIALAIASAVLVAWAAPASAFSKLGREDGSVAEGDGVVATPLPPLQTPNGQAPALTGGSATGAAEPPLQPAVSPQEPAQTTSPAEQAPVPPPAPGSAAPSNEATPPATETPAEEPDATDDQTGDNDVETPPDGTDPAASQQAMPKEPSGPPPDVVYGDNELPAPVRELRAKLLEVARSGDIEKLRAFVQTGEDGTVLSFGGIEGDPIEYLKASSGDGDGVETMAILLEVLESGHIRNEPGSENEIYVWPYFAGLAIDKLTKPQKVELFELITAGDYQEMTAFGAYNFYRVGITPDGKLQFFVAGD